MNIIPNSVLVCSIHDNYHSKWNINSDFNLEYRLSIGEAQATAQQNIEESEDK